MVRSIAGTQDVGKARGENTKSSAASSDKENLSVRKMRPPIVVLASYRY